MYIEHKLITSETPRPDGRTEVILMDEASKEETTELISSELLPFIRTETPIDATELRKLSCAPIVKEMMIVLQRFYPRVEDIQHILQYVGNSVKINVERADDLKYGKPYLDRRLDVYDDILRASNPPEIPEGK